MLKKAWHDPVWSKVISAGIIGICVAIPTYLIGWWPIMGQWLLSDRIMPNWLLIVLGGITAWRISTIGCIWVYKYKQDARTKKDLENQKAQYQLEKTDGGALVYAFIGTPKHYACPDCFNEGVIRIIQEDLAYKPSTTVRGLSQCFKCKNRYRIAITGKEDIEEDIARPTW